MAASDLLRNGFSDDGSIPGFAESGFAATIHDARSS
jgi:hypothetical protein